MLIRYITVIMLVLTTGLRAENLLKNPGFESGDQSWKCMDGKASEPRFSIDKKVKHSGKAALAWQSRKDSGYVMSGQVVKLIPGRTYRLSAWVKTENLTGARESGATVCMGYLDNNDKHLNGGPHPGGIKGTTDWTLITAYTGPVPEDAKAGSVTCYVRKGRKKSFTGNAWWDDVCLEPVSFECRVLKPSYKKTFTNERNELELEFETYPEDYKKNFSDLTIVVKVYNSEKSLVFERKFTPEKRLERKDFTLAELKPGNYSLQVLLEDKSGRQLWCCNQKLIKAQDNYKPKVYIDKYGRTIIDGNPFFPLGVYTRTASWATNGVELDAQLKLLKYSGFNCIMPYDALNKAQMDACAAADIKVIYSVKDYFCRIWYCPGAIRSKQDEVPQMLKVIKKWRNHPALLAWYVNDELGPDVLDSHQEHYDAINVADPDHPSWNLHNKPQEMTSMINSCDAMGVDEYPVPDNKLSDVSKAVENTVDATRNSRAVWAVPQICNLGVHYGSKMPDARPPKLFELRSMAWQAICAGADGLIFYCLHDCLKDEKFPFQQQWPNIRRMSLEIDKYAPVLLSIEELPEIKVNAPAWLKWTARNYQGTVYIFAVNSGKDSGTASFSVAGKIQSVEKIRLNEDKAKQKIDSNPSSWKDKILPDEVCIYLVKLK